MSHELVTFGKGGPVVLRTHRDTGDMRAAVHLKRGEISEYSKHSKVRLRRQLYRLHRAFYPDEGPRAVMFCLTMPGDGVAWWEIDHKRALDAFQKAFRRAWPDAFGVWVREYQARGAVHYQGAWQFGPFSRDRLPARGPRRAVLVRDLETGQPFWTDVELHPVQEWAESTWSRTIGHPARVECETLRARNTAYLAKEASKTVQKGKSRAFAEKAAAHGIDHTGRWWGLFNRALVQAHEWQYTQELTPDAAAEFEALCDRYWRPRLQALGRKHGWTGELRVPRFLPEDEGAAAWLEDQ